MNPDTKTTLSQIKQVCERHGVHYVSHERITYGFSHEVHRINKDLIIKIYDAEHHNKFRTERDALASTYHFQKPVLIASGAPDSIFGRYYIIMSYIPGKSLGSMWHQANDTQREKLISSVCKNLQVINTIDPTSMELKQISSWQSHLIKRINTLTDELVKKNTIDVTIVEQIHDFIHSVGNIFQDTPLHTTYWDIHFDNFIVNESFELQALIDLENIEITSLDYPLFVIRKQMNDPAKYLSLEDEKYARIEDYEKLEYWYRKYYPEMFAFDNLEQRIRVYQLIDTLHLLNHWPKVKELYVALNSLINK